MGRLIRAPRTAPVSSTPSTSVAAGERGDAERAARAGALRPEERQRLEAEARRRGYEAGQAEARRQLEGEQTRILLAAHREANALLAEARKAAVPLAVRMAEKIVGREIAREPAVLLELLSQAIRATGLSSGPIELRVHPEDARLIEAQQPALAAKLATTSSGGSGSGLLVRWVLDEAVGRAGCVVETRKMRLDARLATQLEVLAEALLGQGGKGTPGGGGP